METACILRFDDMVRSERYFTATLLPAILLHARPSGLDAFLKLVCSKALQRGGQSTERDRSGEARRRRDRCPTWSPDTVELITEFHIARDLKFARRLATATRVPAVDQVTEPVTHDAPDLVIVLDDELVVCEGKFFDDYTLTALNRQLHSQRRQVAHLFDDRSHLIAYRHVAILPEEGGVRPDCDAVLTWGEIADLAAEILGCQHYVTARLRAAVEHWQTIHRRSSVRNYDDTLPLDATLDKCGMDGDSIQVGIVGGEQALRDRPLTYLERRRWKWRETTNAGKVVRNNWIAGDRFVELIEDRRRQDTETPER